MWDVRSVDWFMYFWEWNHKLLCFIHIAKTGHLWLVSLPPSYAYCYHSTPSGDTVKCQINASSALTNILVNSGGPGEHFSRFSDKFANIWPIFAYFEWNIPSQTARGAFIQAGAFIWHSTVHQDSLSKKEKFAFAFYPLYKKWVDIMPAGW